jgi:lipoate-protein ligase A
VTAPIDPAEPLRQTYSRINRILLDGLARLGVVAGIAAPSERAPAPSIRPCFETPGEGELVADGGKLVGSAQWRDDGALLQHGSILVEDDQSSLNSFAAGAMNESFTSIGQPATLAALLGRSPDAAEVAGAMFDAVRALEDANATELDEDEIRAAASRHVPHFLDTEWTWRR